jgi:hypothetical protein
VQIHSTEDLYKYYYSTFIAVLFPQSYDQFVVWPQLPMMVQFTLCRDQMKITPEANAGEDTLSSSKEKEATTWIFAAVTHGHSLSGEAQICNACLTSN